MNSELEFEPRHGDSTNYGGREEAAARTAAAGCAPRAGRRQGGARATQTPRGLGREAGAPPRSRGNAESGHPVSTSEPDDG